MDKNLIELADKYRSTRNFSNLSDAIYHLYESYLKGNEKTLMDAVASTIAINSIFLADEIEMNKITPQMQEAWELSNPNTELSSLSGNPEQIQGYLTSLKGKYFEVIVRDELNAGNSVGDIQLEYGQTAILGESPTQPGWDLQIVNADNTVATELQLKATNSLGYVESALKKYPDIDVVTTSEVFESTEDVSSQIFNSGMSDEALEQTVKAPMVELLDTPFGELVEDILPGLPFVIIAVGEGRKVIMGRTSFEEAFASALERTIKTGTAIGVGAIVALMDGGLLSLPASFLTRLGIDRYKIMGNSLQRIEAKTITIRKIYPLYH